MMRVIGPKGLRVGAVRIHDREHVRHGPVAVMLQLLEAADGQKRNRNRLHDGALARGALIWESRGAPCRMRHHFVAGGKEAADGRLPLETTHVASVLHAAFICGQASEYDIGGNARADIFTLSLQNPYRGPRNGIEPQDSGRAVALSQNDNLDLAATVAGAIARFSI
jgi:hypothetical protein